MSERKYSLKEGDRFGHLTYIAEYSYPYALFKCDCGKVKRISIYNVLKGDNKSCGCSKSENTKTHGLSKDPIYRRWTDMRTRCNNPNAMQWKHYGGKGIRVCEEWNDPKKGFLNFYEWSMSNGFSPELTIDRIDADKDYSPDNCRWATWTEQNLHLARKNHSSQYVGISKHSSGYGYYGRVKVDKKVVCTGWAHTELEAAQKRERYIIEHGLGNALNGVAI